MQNSEMIPVPLDLIAEEASLDYRELAAEEMHQHHFGAEASTISTYSTISSGGSSSAGSFGCISTIRNN